MNPSDFIRTDEIEDVISTAEFLSDLLQRARSHTALWKWVIICAHNCLQGALVCSLSGSAGLGALDRKSQKKALEWHQKDRSGIRSEYPEEKLANFAELLNRAQRSDNMAHLDGEPLTLTDEDRSDLKYLNDTLRNSFQHFKPKGWSIEYADLPRVIGVAIRSVDALTLCQPGILVRMEDEQAARLKRSIENAKSHLEQLTKR